MVNISAIVLEIGVPVAKTTPPPLFRYQNFRKLRRSDCPAFTAGWSAGAQNLGVKLPAWIVHHGSKRSWAAVINTFRVFRIILTNAVKYVTNVESYDRRIQSAIHIQGKKMQRRAEFLLTRALRQAGWK